MIFIASGAEHMVREATYDVTGGDSAHNAAGRFAVNLRLYRASL